MDFDTELDRVKQRFDAWRALVVLDDKPLRRYVMCWRPSLVRRVSDWPVTPGIASLWDCVHVDLQGLATYVLNGLAAIGLRFALPKAQ